MKYIVCPECGAHLDPCEHCDCQDKKEDASAATETPSSLKPTTSLSDPSINVNASLRLSDLRRESGSMAKDIAVVVQSVFPKFNRQLLSQCEAWEKYGVVLHPDGIQAICQHYGIQPQKPSPTPPSRKPTAPVSGLSQYDRILRHMRDYGSITSLEAVREYGIMSLSSRICQLKRRGYCILTTQELGKNRYNEDVRFVRYSLVEVSHDDT